MNRRIFFGKWGAIKQLLKRICFKQLNPFKIYLSNINFMMTFLFSLTRETPWFCFCLDSVFRPKVIRETIGGKKSHKSNTSKDFLLPYDSLLSWLKLLKHFFYDTHQIRLDEICVHVILVWGNSVRCLVIYHFGENRWVETYLDLPVLVHLLRQNRLLNLNCFGM